MSSVNCNTVSKRTPHPLHQIPSFKYQNPHSELKMTTFLENSYSFVQMDNAADQPSIQQLQQLLEKGTDESKCDTMRRILTIMLNGEPLSQLLMHIIRFVMPSKYKPLKKLLYFYYEICPKLDANGKLKQEFILVWWARLYIEPFENSG